MSSSDNNIVLPKGWKQVKLGEVCKLKNGYAFKSSEYKTEGIPVIRISDIKSGIVKPDNSVKVNERSEYHDFLVNEGEILVAMSGATTGKFGVYKSKSKAYQNQRVGKFKILNDVSLDSDFLLHQLHALKRKIEKDAYGGAQPNISSGKIEAMEILLPPKPIQQTIVSKIEELFSELDKGIEQLKTAQQQLKTYRQSVLNTLIPKKNYLAIVDVIDKLDQGWSPKCENEPSIDKTEWAVIKTSAIQHGYFIELENKRLPKDLKPREQHELMPGDILITRAGPRIRVGVCCMIKNIRPKLINCDKAYRIRVNLKFIKPEYLEFILNTPYYLDVIEKMKTGISDSGLNLTQKAFTQIKIPVPSIKEQIDIVQEIESGLSVADKMEESITQSLQKAEVLRQSILKKAFEGKLI